MAAQPVAHYRIAQVAQRRRECAPDCGRALVEILLYAADEIVRQRFDLLRLLECARRRHIARCLALSNGIEKSHSVATARAARDLSRSQNCRVVGSIGEISDAADIAIQLRRSANATRVEEVQAGGIAAEEAVHAAEIEGIAASDEEWPLLLIVRLVGGEIDRRWIDLDLAEVRIYRGIEGETRSEQILDVRARAHTPVTVAVIGIAWRCVFVLLTRFDVRKQLELTRLRADREPGQRSVVRRPARLTHSPERPHVLLVQSVGIAPNLQSPRLQAVPRETQLRVRDPHLSCPAE